MFTARQYRAKATEYCNLMKIANSPDELREYQQLERSFTELADNAQWAADNYNKTEHATASVALGPVRYSRFSLSVSKRRRFDGRLRRDGRARPRCRDAAGKDVGYSLLLGDSLGGVNSGQERKLTHGL